MEFSLLDGRRSVDCLQVGGDFLTLFSGNIVQAVPHHMNDTELNLRIREDGLNGFGKPFEAIDAGDEDIPHAPALQLGDDLEPELRAFRLGGPQTKNFLQAVQIDADRQIDGLVNDPAFLPHFNAEGIEIDDRPDFIQRTVLPKNDLFLNRLGHLRNQCR